MDKANPMEGRKCSAKARSGKRCKRWAIVGGKVCPMHGGKAPQVVRSARERLTALVDPALTVLEERLRDAKEPAMQIAVAKDLLDRAGYSSKHKVEVSGVDGAAMKFDLSVFSDADLETFSKLAGRAFDGS